MVGKPSQLPTEVSRSNPPQQIPPDSQVSLAQKSETKASQNTQITWKDFVDVVSAISAKQNDGTPKLFRGCQPELKLCISGISYRDKQNKDMAIKVVRDMNEKIVAREICELNPTSDIRLCTDWDRGTSHRDMKDMHGEWHKVADE